MEAMFAGVDSALRADFDRAARKGDVVVATDAPPFRERTTRLPHIAVARAFSACGV
jgi:hypothetical protein